MAEEQERRPDRSTDALLLDLAVVMLGGHPVDVDVLLQALLESSKRSFRRGDVEAAMNRLIGAGLLRIDGDRVGPTEAATALRHPMRRAKGSNRLKRLEVALAELVAPTGPALWRLDQRRWASIVGEHGAHQRRRLEDRASIVDALLRALDEMDDINAAVRAARDSRLRFLP